MSIFECVNRHLILGYGRCQICGGSAYYMDGQTNEEIEADEKEAEEEE